MKQVFQQIRPLQLKTSSPFSKRSTSYLPITNGLLLTGEISWESQVETATVLSMMVDQPNSRLQKLKALKEMKEALANFAHLEERSREKGQASDLEKFGIESNVRNLVVH